MKQAILLSVSDLEGFSYKDLNLLLNSVDVNLVLDLFAYLDIKRLEEYKTKLNLPQIEYVFTNPRTNESITVFNVRPIRQLLIYAIDLYISIKQQGMGDTHLRLDLLDDAYAAIEEKKSNKKTKKYSLEETVAVPVAETANQFLGESLQGTSQSIFAASLGASLSAETGVFDPTAQSTIQTGNF